MVEIFTLAAGQQGDATRAVSDSIRLAGPSDVYFGPGVAGIAFYEKSGADLRVTLLDGQEVLIRDFFVIGPGGEFSRLLDGGAQGEVEVTGLIAPEPFLPPETTAVAEAPAEPPGEPAAAATAPISQGSDEEVITVTVGGAEIGGADIGAEDSSGVVAGGGGAYHGGGFLGLTPDRTFFLGALVPVGLTVFQNHDGDGGSNGSQAAIATTEPVVTEPVVDEPTPDPAVDDAAEGAETAPDTAGAGMDTEIAQMLAAIADGAGTASAPDAGTLGAGPEAEIADGADLAALSSLLDMLALTVVEG